MNAVNLIPRESRSRREITSVSPPTLAVMGGLVVALVAAVLYDMAANTVATRKTELTQVTAGVAGWTAAANSYASFVQTAQRRTQELTDVRQLASSRLPWSGLLGQIGGLMPRAAALSTLQAGTGSAGATSSTPATSGASVPTVELTGCAASQFVVAQTMVQLHRVTGVSDVTLSSSSDSSAASGTAGSSSSSAASGDCPFSVQFQVSLTFTPSAAAGTATSGTGTTASTTATSTSTGASTTPTPVAAQ